MTIAGRLRAGLLSLRGSLRSLRHSLPSGDLTLPPTSEQGGRADVVVLGAGLAGLAAAWRLVAGGRSAVVLEARDRPGGRVWTRREGPPGVPPVEAGAARIRDDHLWTRAFLRLAGVSTEPLYPSEGRLVVAGDDGRWLAPPSLPPWSCHEILASLAEPDPERWTAAGSGRDPAAGLAGWPRRLGEVRWFRAGDGLDRLPGALADALGRRVRYGAEARRVEEGAEGISVRYRTGRGDDVVLARIVVCAVPLTLLGDIDFRPPIPEDRRALAESVPYEAAVRTFVHVRGDEWLPPELNGFGRSAAVGEVWFRRTGIDAPEREGGSRSRSRDGRPGTLVAYRRGRRARPLASLAPERRIRETVEALDALFPGVGAAVVDADTVCWTDDRWSRGARARTWDVEPWPVPALREPHGSVFFAGEHLAHPDLAGWMDGALQAGWTVAGRVERRLG